MTVECTETRKVFAVVLLSTQVCNRFSSTLFERDTDSVFLP